MLDLARYEMPAALHRRLGLLCTGYGYAAHKLARCPPRTLECYAVVWVSSGSGWLETSATSQRLQIVSGSLFWLFPHVTHTYAPDAAGWTEQWALFEGPQAEIFEQLGFLAPAHPVQYVGASTAIEALFTQLREDFTSGGTFTSVLSATLISRLIIVAHQLAVEQQARHDPAIRKIEQCRRWLDEHACEVGEIETLATNYHMGYSTFRRYFRNITGCSPKEYVLRVRMRKAKELLVFTQQSIVEVARSVGFADPYYFSRLFHEKEGLSPSQFRLQQRSL
ncbi:MAG: helix-turn-helix transcriptional regulator [Ktedonobacteraceae bacterium]|nr:helix-turn-helix transcriptional regulator [Ktedonobacteraceae bacterium]